MLKVGFCMRVALTAGASTISLIGAAHAQDASIASPAAAAPAEDQAESTDDIVVTATRRPERMQKVPIAISIVDGETLRANNLNNLRDITSQVPSLNFRTAASAKDQALFLRGLGTVSTSPGVESSVSTVVDGVVLARQGQATMDLLDVDHIEVLRGPQGTLFGKNASSGVLNIVTRRPGFNFEGFGDAAFYAGNGNEWRVRGGVSGGLVADRVAAGITGFVSHYDGDVRNVFNGARLGGFDKHGARAKLLLKPGGGETEILLAADYMHSKDTSPQGVVTTTTRTAFPTNAVTSFPAFAAALSPVVASRYNRTINSNYDTFSTDTNWGVSMEINAPIGNFDFTSVSAYREWTNTQFQDQDRLPGAVVGFPQQHDRGGQAFNQLSQELRLASPKGDAVDFVVGLFAFRGKNGDTYRRETIVRNANNTTATYNGVATYGVTTTNYAAFGEANIHFSERFRMIAGMRFIHDDVEYHYNRVSTSAVPVPGIQAAFASTGSTSATDFSGRAGLQFDIGSRAMTYVTYSRGYKGPAYNISFSMLPQDTLALKPETSDAYEAGLKSRFFNGAVQLNLAAFLTKFANYQVPFFDVLNGSAITRLINAGRVSTRGVEVDLSAKLSRAFTLSGALAYTDAKIDSFTCPAGTNASCLVNGYPLPFAPKWKGNARIGYRVPLSDTLDLTLGTDFSAQTKTQYSINQTPDTIEPGFVIWNGTIGLASVDGLEINLLVKNITNRSYSPYLQTFGQGVVRFVPRDDRRYFGINVHKKF